MISRHARSVAADPRLNIRKGELIRDNHGDYLDI